MCCQAGSKRRKACHGRGTEQRAGEDDQAALIQGDEAPGAVRRAASGGMVSWPGQSREPARTTKPMDASYIDNVRCISQKSRAHRVPKPLVSIIV